ncbi:MAG: DUF3822 family protein [Bacteroidales bacterium]|jgi:hypothetical protein|nr:DUF3822 family protein [Bacteroidales bacterium]
MPVKISQKLSFVDEALNAQEQNMISILLTQDGFSFAVYNRERNKFVALEAYNIENIHHDVLEKSFFDHVIAALKVVIENSKLISLYRNSKGIITFCPNQATWLPSSLFNPDEKERYILLNYGETLGDVFYKINNQTESVCIYTIYNSFIDDLLNLFPNAEIHPLQNILVEDFQRFSKKNDLEKSVYCFVTKERLFIQVYHASKLVFDNNFNFQNKQDFVYFLLNIYDKMDLSPENTPLFFTGDISKSNESWNIIKKYIRRVETLPSNNSFLYSRLFNNADIYHFYHLFSSITCVLLEEFGKGEE